MPAQRLNFPLVNTLYLMCPNSALSRATKQVKSQASEQQQRRHKVTMQAQGHEESIYELLPQQQPVMSKPPMYRSKVRRSHNSSRCSGPRSSCPFCVLFQQSNMYDVLFVMQHPGELTEDCSSRRVRPAATMGRPQVSTVSTRAAQCVRSLPAT